MNTPPWVGVLYGENKHRRCWQGRDVQFANPCRVRNHLLDPVTQGVTRGLKLAYAFGVKNANAQPEIISDNDLIKKGQGNGGQKR